MNTYIPENVVVFHLKAECDEVGLRKFCRNHSIDPGHVSRISTGETPMTANVAELLGYKQIKVYVMREI